MPDKTNITDFDRESGVTTTTLVTTHDRGVIETATAQGQEHDTWHREEVAVPDVQPTLTSVTPNSKPHGMTYTITVAGADFAPNINGYWEWPASNGGDGSTWPATITYVSPTQVTAQLDTTAMFPTWPGFSPQVRLYVRNGTSAYSVNNYGYVGVAAPWPKVGTAGADWSPTPMTRPANHAELLTIVPLPTASPATAWATGQSIQCQDGSRVHWNGTAWIAGVAP